MRDILGSAEMVDTDVNRAHSMHRLNRKYMSGQISNMTFTAEHSRKGNQQNKRYWTKRNTIS